MNGGTQLYIPPLTPVNKRVLIATAACFVLQSLVQKIAGVSLPAILGLSPHSFGHGHLYQIFTYPLVHLGLMNTLFDGLVIWFIGSELESLWGGRTYSKFLLTSVLSAGIFYLGCALAFSSTFPLTGITGISYALLLGYAILFPQRILTFMLIFPMRAKYFCMIITGVLLFGGLMSHNLASWGHLGAMLGAFGYLVWTTAQRQGKNPFKQIYQRLRPPGHHLTLIKDKKSPPKDPPPPKYWQ